MGKHNKGHSRHHELPRGGFKHKVKKKHRDQQQPEAQIAAMPPVPIKANPQSRTSSTTRAHLTSASFGSLGLSAPTARALCDIMRYENMTLVQEQTLPTAMQGSDIIAKARTGTGKTIGFLLPTIELLVRSPPPATARAIFALAISPTRELASQIRAEVCLSGDRVRTF